MICVHADAMGLLIFNGSGSVWVFFPRGICGIQVREDPAHVDNAKRRLNYIKKSCQKQLLHHLKVRVDNGYGSGDPVCRFLSPLRCCIDIARFFCAFY